MYHLNHLMYHLKSFQKISPLLEVCLKTSSGTVLPYEGLIISLLFKATSALFWLLVPRKDGLWKSNINVLLWQLVKGDQVGWVNFDIVGKHITTFLTTVHLLMLAVCGQLPCRLNR